jgi:hypothetical protein
VQMNCYAHFPNLLTCLNEIQCSESLRSFINICKIREHRCSGHTFLTGVSERFLYFTHFYSGWITFGTREVNRTFFSICEFHKQRCTESQTLLKNINEFMSVLSELIVRSARNSMYYISPYFMRAGRSFVIIGAVKITRC